MEPLTDRLIYFQKDLTESFKTTKLRKKILEKEITNKQVDDLLDMILFLKDIFEKLSEEINNYTETFQGCCRITVGWKDSRSCL